MIMIAVPTAGSALKVVGGSGFRVVGSSSMFVGIKEKGVVGRGSLVGCVGGFEKITLSMFRGRPLSGGDRL